MSSSVPTASPRLLVSVRDPVEAEIARAAGADLVDAKDPTCGALGALPEAVASAIVARVGDAVTTSVVAGEPENETDLGNAVAAMVATRADYIKVALGACQDGSALSRVATTAPARLIAVLFAEDQPRLDTVARLARAGFRGAMIDTRGKDRRRLTDHLDIDRLAAFTAACRRHGMLSGLAGSLRLEDVPSLAVLAPDYLGFRGGLCLRDDRTSELDPARIRAVAAALREPRRRDAA